MHIHCTTRRARERRKERGGKTGKREGEVLVEGGEQRDRGVGEEGP